MVARAAPHVKPCPCIAPHSRAASNLSCSRTVMKLALIVAFVALASGYSTGATTRVLSEEGGDSGELSQGAMFGIACGIVIIVFCPLAACGASVCGAS